MQGGHWEGLFAARPVAGNPSNIIALGARADTVGKGRLLPTYVDLGLHGNWADSREGVGAGGNLATNGGAA